MIYEVEDTSCIFLIEVKPLSHRRHAALPVLLIPETKYKVTYAKVKISREPNSVGFIKLVSSSC